MLGLACAALGFLAAVVAQDDLQGPNIYNLSQLSWSLHNTNGSIVVPAKVPSCAHLDLLAAGVITEPTVGLNDGLQRWIPYEPVWTYTANASQLSTFASQYDEAYLVFNGLDTVTNEASGNLTLDFGSPTLYADEQHNITGFNATPLSDTYEFLHREMIRKTQSDFGWDWGMAAAPVGVYKCAYLVGLSASNTSAPALYEANTLIDIYRKGQVPNLPPDQTTDWVVNVSAQVVSAQNFPSPQMVISIPELNLTSPTMAVEAIKAGQDSTINASFSVPANAPQLW
ncbi:hypothetical protein BZG36_03550 [Bifiguratus adelaidae]|uniref:Beta-mannosidase A n=1 Tax=Bifiguratus adelaidae TaxID=1938954 RepID=A0A261XZ67_9FUNG|nr:hypothetical protein BZG36_03550 [Bifiguratus adelaidae]